MSARVRAVVGIERTVADLARSEAFYRDGLGFARLAPPAPVPAPVLEAFGLPGAAATRLTMRLGAQRIGFLAFDPPGAPYPEAPRATDPFFQHAAISVRDMDAAFAHLAAAGPGAISVGGPRTLPPEAGGVTAYKFRDPDGHPLELIFFPDGPPAARWREAPGLFLGLDHSAVTVTDRAAALAFYGDLLGLAVIQRGVNRGEGQARLDGVPDPEVEVIGLAPAGTATPHVEVLHYRRPAAARPTRAPFGPRDRATTRLVLAADDLAGTAAAIRAAGYPAALAADGSTAYAEGPDGHGSLLVAS